MNLPQKLFHLRPNLTVEDFYSEGTIALHDDNDGQGPYIKSWNHPTETQPTDEELGAIE